MTYFSRLTDIVSCNLSEILASNEDPAQALESIITEMREGYAGAERAVNNALRQQERIDTELKTYQSELDDWLNQAKTALQNNEEETARKALRRKKEIEDVVAGLEQQAKAAEATVKHLSTTFRAVEARLNEALRKQAVLLGEVESSESQTTLEVPPSELEQTRTRSIEDELEGLKKEMGL